VDPPKSLPQFPRYRVTQAISEGLLTQVYRGESEALGHTVVLKVLRSASGAASPLYRQFAAEARMLSSLQHPNLVRLHDFDPGGQGERPPFMALEFVDGADLASVLSVIQRLESEEVAMIAFEAAKGLAYAHSMGVVHRDFKPANVVIGSVSTASDSAPNDDSPPPICLKVLDFSSAYSGGDESADDISVGGTPAYMSPEQLLGEAVDHRSDQFALGIMMFQMLCGARPFDGEDGRPIVTRVRREPPRSFRSFGVTVPKAIERLILRCLSKRPIDRFAKTDEIVEVLSQFLTERGLANQSARILRRVLARAGFVEERARIRDPDEPPPPSFERQSPLRPRSVPLWHTLVVVTFVSVAMTSGGILFQWRLGRLGHAFSPSNQAILAPLESLPHAHLRIIARPWADISIDGRHLDVTPLPGPIPLASGKHLVVFKHPSTTEQRIVDLNENEVRTLRVDLAVPAPSYSDEFSLSPAPSAAPSKSGTETHSAIPSSLVP